MLVVAYEDAAGQELRGDAAGLPRAGPETMPPGLVNPLGYDEDHGGVVALNVVQYLVNGMKIRKDVQRVVGPALRKGVPRLGCHGTVAREESRGDGVVGGRKGVDGDGTVPREHALHRRCRE